MRERVEDRGSLKPALSFTPQTWCYNTHPWISMELANNGNSQEWSRFVSDYDFPHDSTFDSILSLLACKVKCFNCSFCDILTDKACCLHNNKLAWAGSDLPRGSYTRFGLPFATRYQCTMHGRIFPPIFSDHSFFFKNKRIFLVISNIISCHLCLDL